MLSNFDDLLAEVGKGPDVKARVKTLLQGIRDRFELAYSGGADRDSFREINTGLGSRWEELGEAVANGLPQPAEHTEAQPQDEHATPA